MSFNVRHRNLGPADNHPFYTFVFPNEASRLAATGFVPADVGKAALQLSDNTFWALASVSPVTTWTPMGGAGGPNPVVASGRFEANTFQFFSLKGCTAVVDPSIVIVDVTLSSPLLSDEYVCVVMPDVSSNTGFVFTIQQQNAAPHINVHAWQLEVVAGALASSETSNFGFRWVVLKTT